MKEYQINYIEYAKAHHKSPEEMLKYDRERSPHAVMLNFIWWINNRRRFEDPPTIDELAESQGVKPTADARVFFGTWPDQENDGFEESIDELRRVHRA